MCGFIGRVHRPSGTGVERPIALRAARGGGAAIDRTLRGTFWDLSYVPPDRSILSGCSPVPPGEVWAFDWDGTRLDETSCRPVAEPLRPAPPGAVADHLSSLID